MQLRGRTSRLRCGGASKERGAVEEELWLSGVRSDGGLMGRRVPQKVDHKLK